MLTKFINTVNILILLNTITKIKFCIPYWLRTSRFNASSSIKFLNYHSICFQFCLFYMPKSKCTLSSTIYCPSSCEWNSCDLLKLKGSWIILPCTNCCADRFWYQLCYSKGSSLSSGFLALKQKEREPYKFYTKAD